MKGERTLQKIVTKSKLYLKRNSSTILTCIGAVGVIATAVAAAKATPKALKRLEQAEENKGEKLTKAETVLVATPSYIPSVVMGVSTIACIFGANVLNKRQQAAIASAYALIDRTYKDYRNKVKELYGEETDNQIRDAIAVDKIKEIDVYTPGCGSLDIYSGEKRLFYEEHYGGYFESTIEAVQNAEYHFNRNFALRGFANLNEFYEFLGLEPTEEGGSLGWSAWQLQESGLVPWVDFSHRDVVVADDGLKCCFIDIINPPELGYEEH